MAKPVTAPTRRAMIKTGTYTGNGVDNRNIDIGIKLSAKQNVFVLIKGTIGYCAFSRIEYGQGDSSMCFTDNPDYPNVIKALTATGFQVGTQVYVNSSGYVYRYIVIYQEG